MTVPEPSSSSHSIPEVPNSLNFPEGATNIKLGDIRTRHELVPQPEIDRANSFMNAKGANLPIREGMDIDVNLGD